MPQISRSDFVDLLPGAIGIVLVAFAEALAAARYFAAKHKYEIGPNRELAALVFANLASGVTQGFVGQRPTWPEAREPSCPLSRLLVILLTPLFLMSFTRSGISPT
jgi:hypothetical protein